MNDSTWVRMNDSTWVLVLAGVVIVIVLLVGLLDRPPRDRGRHCADRRWQRRRPRRTPTS